MTRLLTARRTLAASALAPLLATGLVACGDDSGGDSAAEPAAQAAALSEDLEEGDEVDPAEFVQIVSDGLEASTTAHMTMSMDAGSYEMEAEGDIDYTTTPPEMAMTMSVPMMGGDMDIRMVDGIMYMSMGELTQGKFWKLDPAEKNGPLGDLGMDGLLDQMDPGKALESMEEGISQVVYVGEEDDLDHYELTVDMQQALDQLGGDLPPGAGADLPETLTYDLWLDDEGRFTKLSMDELPMGGTEGAMEMTISGWDEEVDIEAPAADEVTEMPDLDAMMQGMTGGAGSA